MTTDQNAIQNTLPEAGEVTIASLNPKVDLVIEPDEPQALLALLEDDDPMVRWQAAESLAQLARAKQSKTAPFWAKAIGRDAELDVSAILDALAAALERGDVSVRMAVVDALGAWQHTECIALLRSSLADESEDVRASAATALGKCADVDSIDSLLALAQDDESVWVRTAAIDALGTLQQARVAPALCSILNELEETSRGAESAVGLQKTRLLMALGRLDHGHARSALMSYVEQDDDPTLRWIAARGLTQIGGAQALVALEALLGDNTVILGRTMDDVAIQAISAIRRREQGLTTWLRKTAYRVIRNARRLLRRER